MSSSLEGIFTLAAPAGGTGRTTLALTIGTLLAQSAMEVLLVDLDPRGSLTFLSGVNERHPGILHALSAQEPMSFIRSTTQVRLSLLPSDLENVAQHAQLEMALADWRALPRLLEPLRRRYQIILIDTPAGISRVSRSAIAAADEVLIPLLADPLAIRTLPWVLDAIVDARQVGVSRPRMAGMFLNRIDPAAPLLRQLVDDLSNRFQPLMLDTAIPADPWFVEAAARAMPLPLLLPEARGVAAVTGLIEELKARLA